MIVCDTDLGFQQRRFRQKAHGIGFLFSPQHSPKDWDKDVPLWIYELWDYIVRGELGIRREEPSWLDVAQMMAVVRTGYTRLLRSLNLSIVPQKSSRPVTLM